jgi:hypothetical protein
MENYDEFVWGVDWSTDLNIQGYGWSSSRADVYDWFNTQPCQLGYQHTPQTARKVKSVGA